MKSKVAVLAMLAGIALSSVAHAEIELSKYPRAYKGEEGLQIKMVSLKGEKKQALIEVTGVDTEVDGVVFLADEDDNGKALKITLHGEAFYLLRSSETWYGWKSMEVHLPEHVMKGLNVYYDEKESKKIQPSAMLKTHQKQSKDGTIAKLAKWNRPDREKYNNTEYAKEAEFAEKQCEMKVPASIDWKTVTDDHLKELSISSYCSGPFFAMRQACEHNKKAAVQAKVKKIICRFGAGMKLTLSPDGTLTWITSKDASNADDFAKNNLDNLL